MQCAKEERGREMGSHVHFCLIETGFENGQKWRVDSWISTITVRDILYMLLFFWLLKFFLFFMVRMARTLAHMTRVARIVTHMARWLAHLVHLVRLEVVITSYL